MFNIWIIPVENCDNDDLSYETIYILCLLWYQSALKGSCSLRKNVTLEHV